MPPSEQSRFHQAYRQHLLASQRQEVLRVLRETLDPDTTLGEIVDAAESLGWGEPFGDMSLGELADALIEGVEESEPASVSGSAEERPVPSRPEAQSQLAFAGDFEDDEDEGDDDDEDDLDEDDDEDDLDEDEDEDEDEEPAPAPAKKASQRIAKKKTSKKLAKQLPAKKIAKKIPKPAAKKVSKPVAVAKKISKKAAAAKKASKKQPGKKKSRR